MAVIIPKDLRRFRFAKAVPLDLTGALIDIVMPALFQRAVLENRELANANIDASDIDGPINDLAESNRMEGFQTAIGRRALDKLVRSSLVSIGYKGSGRKETDKQLEGIIPYSIASFKVGLPRSRTRLRNIDQFLYYLLLVEFDSKPKRVSDFLTSVFGSGVKVTGHPRVSFERIDASVAALDIFTDLSITFLEQLPSLKPREKPTDRHIAQPLPVFQSRFGNDLYRYLWSYRDRVPTSVLIDQVVTLVTFELTLFTTSLMSAMSELTENPTSIPPLMNADPDIASGAGPVIFVDMVGDLRGINRLMAASCVRRSLGSIDPFIRSILHLRYLDSLKLKMHKNPTLQPLLDNIPVEDATPQYLQALLTLKNDPRLAMHLDAMTGFDLGRIVEANVSIEPDEDPSEVQSPLEEDLESMTHDGIALELQIVKLLFDSQVVQIRQNILSWLTSVGGVDTSYGLINGRADRRSWAYAPPNDLLTVLIQLRAIDYKGWNPAKGANPGPFSVPEFLEWLEDRFGIIVDRPPAGLGFDGPEHMAAARDNLRAMLRRLRQMGVFEDQSDDFSVQMLTPPYLEPAPAAPSARHA